MRKYLVPLLALAASGSFLAVSSALAVDARALLNSKCSSCHAKTGDGLKRIKDSRRTPEGWDMDLARMSLLHGVKYEDGERAALVKHLADTQGLAPAETTGWRYILERRPGIVEQPENGLIGEMCGRCHSYARLALQRRTQEDWLKLAHFHMGQFPTVEYQAMGRDRNWWEIASTEIPALLAKHYPLTTQAWSQWQSRDRADLAGEWRVAGHASGVGSYEGVMRVSAKGGDHYGLKLTLNYANGTSVTGSGNAIVYTGHEWRGSIDMGGKTIRQVFSANETGSALSGRWFDDANDLDGGDLRAVRGGPAIVAVIPEYLRAGQPTQITVHGVDLAGGVDLGEGVKVLQTVSSTANKVVVRASAAAGAAIGRRDVSVGDAKAVSGLAVFESIGNVRVKPANTIARVGGAGGPLPPVPAQFDAVAYANGADEKPGTDDDVRIGVWPAAWSVENADETAAQLQDSKYAGTMGAASGLFMPAGAGLNPQRRFSTNNAGVLTVKATVKDGEREVVGSGRLIVTVQRWNDPPIR